MYVYIQSEKLGNGLWTVGFYKPDGKWAPESDHQFAELAAKRVAYLNGGLVEDLRAIFDAMEARIASLEEQLATPDWKNRR